MSFQQSNPSGMMSHFSNPGMLNSSIPALPSSQANLPHLKTEPSVLPPSSTPDDMLGTDAKSCPIREWKDEIDGSGMNSPDWHGSAGCMGLPLGSNSIDVVPSSSSPTSHQHLQASLPCNSPMSASSSLPPLCAGCRLRIVDKFYLCAVEAKWHTACLKCAECGVELESQLSCFERDGQIYCKDDYLR